MVGKVDKKSLVLRNGAQKGDYIFVTGKIGKGKYNKNHLYFTPRVKEAEVLVKFFKPSSMIDVSDGLALDLYRILKESRKGAILYEEKLPLYHNSVMEDAFFWGEDYELLFTLPELVAKKFMSSPRYKKYEFSYIGNIVEGEKIYLRKRDGRMQIIPFKGFVHSLF